MDSHEKLLQELQELNLALLLHIRRQLEDGCPPETLHLSPDMATLLVETPTEQLVRLCSINQSLFWPSVELLREAIQREVPRASVKDQLLCEASEEEKTPKARRAQGGR
ncbi:flagellar transcriptional regulator FlhD [Halomonas faecis]|uniref:flagellar transcriptional regulator FlhD n=1 Tax=Halomonas faecis TaxID=1562110 RepID=UPI0013D31353|nr:flagellar transcriptional regulator FlhD [Halomonas faecis]